MSKTSIIVVIQYHGLGEKEDIVIILPPPSTPRTDWDKRTPLLVCLYLSSVTVSHSLTKLKTVTVSFSWYIPSGPHSPFDRLSSFST